MIDIKDTNYISGTPNDIQVGGSKVFSFLDVAGKNILLLSNDSFDSGLYSWTQTAKKKFHGIDDFEKVLSENLFRVDYLIIDIYRSCTFLGMKEYEQRVRKQTSIPIIFIIQITPDIDLSDNRDSLLSRLKKKENCTFYIFSKSMPKDSSSAWKAVAGMKHGSITIGSRAEEEYEISNLFENWKTTIKQLKLEYIRDKKLEELFKEDGDEI